jgi:PEP-CTERM motif-containing protein
MSGTAWYVRAMTAFAGHLGCGTGGPRSVGTYKFGSCGVVDRGICSGVPSGPNTFSFYLDGAAFVSGVPIPSHINSASIHQFGFDSAEFMPTSQGNHFVLDEVSVEIGTPVPEPATLGLLSLGLAVLVARRRRGKPVSSVDL